MQKFDHSHQVLHMMRSHNLSMFVGLLLAVLCYSELSAQTVIKGSVQDASSGEDLPGVSVFLESYRTGATTNFDGQFRFTTQAKGQAQLVVSMVGYTTYKKTIELGATMFDAGIISLKESTIGLAEAQVIASVAIDRETPVAVSTLDAKTIQEQIGDKELVETLNITPGV